MPPLGDNVPNRCLKLWSKTDFRRGGAGEQWGLIPLGNRGHNLGVPGAERREQKIHLVVGDELLGELRGALTVRLIIIFDELDFHLLAADVDSARRIDLVEPHLPDDVLLFRFVGQRTCQRQRSTDLDHVGGMSGWQRRADRSNQRSGCDDVNEPVPRNLHDFLRFAHPHMASRRPWRGLRLNPG